MFLYEIIMLICIVAFDIGTKYWAVSALEVSNHYSNKVIEIIPKVLSLQYNENTGASFGIFQGKTQILTIFTAIALAALFVFLLLNKNESKFLRVILTLILAGGLGNLYDRIVFGYVRDFLNFEFIDFPVFNVADSAISVSTVLLLVYALFFIKKSPSAEKASEKDALALKRAQYLLEETRAVTKAEAGLDNKPEVLITPKDGFESQTEQPSKKTK